MKIDERPFGPSYPLAFLAKTTAFTALACALGLVILRGVFFQELGTEFAAAFYTIKGMLAYLLPSLVFCVLAVLLVASLAVFAVAVFASHKMAGPLFRLQRVAGHLQCRVLVGHIHLRTADQGKPVARALNEWGASRKAELVALQGQLERCREPLAACEQALADGREGELAGPLRALREALGDLEHREGHR
ncbi:MAG: hypothetical protein P1P84_02315 [Deferrisomatales bacterium]|nr:hypothetical protein [Deferrisomatales bacterium]